MHWLINGRGCSITYPQENNRLEMQWKNYLKLNGLLKPLVTDLGLTPEAERMLKNPGRMLDLLPGESSASDRVDELVDAAKESACPLAAGAFPGFGVFHTSLSFQPETGEDVCFQVNHASRNGLVYVMHTPCRLHRRPDLGLGEGAFGGCRRLTPLSSVNVIATVHAVAASVYPR